MFLSDCNCWDRGQGPAQSAWLTRKSAKGLGEEADGVAGGVLWKALAVASAGLAACERTGSRCATGFFYSSKVLGSGRAPEAGPSPQARRLWPRRTRNRHGRKPARRDRPSSSSTAVCSAALNEGVPAVRSPFPADVPAPTAAGAQGPGHLTPE